LSTQGVFLKARFGERLPQVWDTVKMWAAGKEEWNRHYSEYHRALDPVPANPPKGRTGKSLPEWESYVWDELPAILSTRAPPYITQEELSNITTWKLMRGKWRPRLQALVNSNDDESVREASAAAFGRVDSDPGAAVDALCELKGVGPATAAAVLAILRSDVPFMSDELLSTVPAMNGELKYTKKVFLTLLEESRKKARDLGEGWTARKVERAAFANARLGSGDETSTIVAKKAAKELSGSIESADLADSKTVTSKRGRTPRRGNSNGAKETSTKKTRKTKSSSDQTHDTVEPKTATTKRGRPAKREEAAPSEHSKRSRH
jgi:hypothetical protein